MVGEAQSNESPEWPPSECDIIEGVLNWLNRDGKSFEVSDRPDDHDQHSKTCDYICVDSTTGTKIAVEVITLWRKEDACREDKLWLDFIHEVESSLNGKVAGTYHVYTPMDDMTNIDPGEFSHELGRFLAAQELSENDTVVFTYRGLDWRIHKFRDRSSSVEFARYGAPGEELASDDAVREFIHRNLSDVPDKFAVPMREGVGTHLLCYNTFDALIKPRRLLNLLREEIETLHREGDACVDYAHVMTGHPPQLKDIYVYTVSAASGTGN